jgi:hypothetical protein
MNPSAALLTSNYERDTVRQVTNGRITLRAHITISVISQKFYIDSVKPFSPITRRKWPR